jgi:uncharacterized membrane protein YfcA
METYEYFLAPLIGFTAMVAGGFWGLGGGWFVVPALLILGVSDMVAVGASLLQMLLSSSMTVFKQFKSIGWKKHGWGMEVALPLCLLSFVGGFLGRPAGLYVEGLFNSRKPQQILYLFLLGFIFYKTLWGKNSADETAAPTGPPPSESGKFFASMQFKTGVIGFFVGILSSLLGIGGGTITRPVMKSYLGTPESMTGKISRLAVFITALAGTISYLSSMKSFSTDDPAMGSLTIGLLMATGGFIGFPLGAWMHSKVLATGKGEQAGKSFGWVILMVFVGLFFKIISMPNVSRIIMLICGLFLLIYLFTTTFIACKQIKNNEINL